MPEKNCLCVLSWYFMLVKPQILLVVQPSLIVVHPACMVQEHNVCWLYIFPIDGKTPCHGNNNAQLFLYFSRCQNGSQTELRCTLTWNHWSVQSRFLVSSCRNTCSIVQTYLILQKTRRSEVVACSDVRLLLLLRPEGHTGPQDVSHPGYTVCRWVLSAEWARHQILPSP